MGLTQEEKEDTASSQYTHVMMPSPFRHTNILTRMSRSNRVHFALATIFVAAMFAAVPSHAAAQTANPWTAQQATSPDVLAAKVKQGYFSAKAGQKKAANRPVLIQVGFDVLYRSKHIPGSIYAGPGVDPEGLAMLKKAVAGLPRNSEIYIYCGCCPIDKCPNVRPAFEALQGMGFTHLHVVTMTTSFGKDWVARGYPVAGEDVSTK